MSIPVELMDQNPWWRDPKAILRDKHIVALAESRVRWDPRLKYTFDLNADAVYTLRGPRQVGKTTLLKSMVRHLMKSGVPPRSIFYYTCDLLDSPRALADTVTTYLDVVGSSGKTRSYLLLDEVSSIKDWQRAIKFLVDKGRLASVTLILTGSHTLDIKKASERLPGRRGQVKDTPDKIMLPMKFSEYAETLNKDVRNSMREQHVFSWDKRKQLFSSLLKGEIPVEIKELSFLAKELELLFRDYLLTGGTAKVVNEYLQHSGISEEVYRTYSDVVLGDLARWGKKENYLRQVLTRVLETLGSPVGWNTLKKDTDIASHNTVADYVDTLADAFVLLYFHRYDANRQRPVYEKEKKICFRDPFFLHAMKAWVSGIEPFESTLEFLRNSENVGALVEGIAADHVVRLAFLLSEQKQLFSYENAVFYWRGKKDREVDFVLRADSSKAVPFEVKYQKTIGSEDLFGMIDFMKVSGSRGGIVLSKETLEVRRSVTIVPIWLFLLLV